MYIDTCTCRYNLNSVSPGNDTPYYIQCTFSIV